MSEQPSADQMDRLKDLVSRSDLESISFHELNAKLDSAASGSKETEEVEFDLDVQTRIGDDEFGVRVTVEAIAPLGVVRVVAAAEYSVEGERPDQEVMGLFASEVAMMSIFPYLRQGVADMFQRIFGQALMLPILKRGELTLTPIESDMTS